jgi:hypothetical protein
MLEQAKSAAERWRDRAGPPRLAVRSVFPSDAVAMIYKPAPSPTTSARARKPQWKLRFERRMPPYVEPLMGWTADDDTLASQVELGFPTLEAAIGYARRQALNYAVQGAGDEKRALRLVGAETVCPDSQRLPHARDPANRPNPAHACAADVLADAHLSTQQKRAILQHWAMAAYQLEHGYPNGAGQSSSRLDEIVDALLDLDEMEGHRLPQRIAAVRQAQQMRAA